MGRALVILGAAVWPGGRASPALQRRVKKALALWRAGGIDLIVATGGRGRHPPAEAEVMRRLLVAGGVPDEAILLETQSSSTLTNAAFTAPMLHARGTAEAILVTDGYHAFRSRLAFRRFGVAARVVAADENDPQPSRIRTLRRWAREGLALPVYMVRLYLRPRVRRSRPSGGPGTG